MRWLADLAYLLAGILYSPLALYHILVTGKHRTGWSQRFGRVPRRDLGKKRVWVHAVSLGEVNATPKLVEALQRELPDHEFVFSTTTDTGYARAVQLYGHDRVFRFPLDFSWVITRALQRIHPSIIVLMELEVWYNLTGIATRRRVPVVVANGRLTERSAKRFDWIAPLIKPMFADLAWVGAQDEPTAARFRAVGVRADRIAITSSLKWDTAVVTDRIPGDDTLAASLDILSGSPLWVCGSTGSGEEEIILDAYQRLISVDRHFTARDVPVPNVEGNARPIRLAIVPRKPERFDEVARLIAQRGFDCIRRSAHPDNAPAEVATAPIRAATVRERSSPGTSASALSPAPLPPYQGGIEGGSFERAAYSRISDPVILGDTMGELRKFYSLASIVFVGRSLVPMGGSDVMEVAALGKPILVGPHTDNFREAVASLRDARAIEIVECAESLARAVDRLRQDAATRTALGDRAREVVRKNQGATERTVRGIMTAIGHRSRFAASSALEKTTALREHGKTETASEARAPARP